jgi:hypothetical protein
MKLTIWQCAALVVALIGVYFVYSMWWVKQDQSNVIRKFNGGITGDQNTTTTAKEGGGSDPASSPAAPSPW